MSHSVAQRIGLGLSILALAIAAEGPLSAQVVSFNVERQKWLTQAGTNAIPFVYTFQVTASGSGLSEATIVSPVPTNALSGVSRQMTFSASYPAVSLINSNVVSGLDQLNSAFPTGTYTLRVVVAKTNILNGNVTYTTNSSTAPLT